MPQAKEQERVSIHDFVKANAITLHAERCDDNPYMDPDAKAQMDHWKVKLSILSTIGEGRRTLTTYFSMGYGHNGNKPTAADVLSCLGSDATIEDSAFDEWCRDLGFDTDSRRAERIYNVTVKQTAKLRKFLGDDAFDQLVYHTEPL